MDWLMQRKNKISVLILFILPFGVDFSDYKIKHQQSVHSLPGERAIHAFTMEYDSKKVVLKQIHEENDGHNDPESTLILLMADLMYYCPDDAHLSCTFKIPPKYGDQWGDLIPVMERTLKQGGTVQTRDVWRCAVSYLQGTVRSKYLDCLRRIK